MNLSELAAVQIETLDDQSLRALVRQLLSIAISQQEQIEKLRLENDLLRTENQKLRAELDKRNGPPAFVKPNVPNAAQANQKANAQAKKERKKRSQSFVRKRETPTRTVTHRLETCPDCGHGLSEGTVHRTRQIIDIPVHPVEVVDHQIFAHYCRHCRKRHIPVVDFSTHALGQHRFGVRVMSLIGYLRLQCRQPLETIQTFLSSLYGLKVSEGELTELLHTLARQGKAAQDEILQEVRASPCVHGDETGWRENGRNGYLWGFFTPSACYFHRDNSRSGTVPVQILGEKFKTTLVTDFYAGYNGLDCRHQRCWAHLIRDLRKLQEAHPQRKDIAEWVEQVHLLYEEGVDYQRRCRTAAQQTAVAFGYNVLQRRDKRRAFESRLGLLCAPYLDQKPPEVDPRSVLAERMEKFASELFVFVEFPEVPADNNAAERGLRPAVIARKISGGTRSQHGSETNTTLRTLFATWKLRGEDLLLNCAQLLQQNKTATVTP